MQAKEETNEGKMQVVDEDRDVLTVRRGWRERETKKKTTKRQRRGGKRQGREEMDESRLRDAPPAQTLVRFRRGASRPRQTKGGKRHSALGEQGGRRVRGTGTTLDETL